jgi:formate hydrogenlyase subunit 3/multisubunit Na+/H+ antiporter MnhD subunit
MDDTAWQHAVMWHACVMLLWAAKAAVLTSDLGVLIIHVELQSAAGDGWRASRRVH